MPVIDFAYIDKACAGDAAMRSELVSLFLEQMRKLEPDLSGLLAKGDLMTLAREAHSVKSTALSFGMGDLAAALKKIEIVSKKLLVASESSCLPDSARKLYVEQFASMPLEIQRWTDENLSEKTLSDLVNFCKLQSDLAIAELTEAANGGGR